MQLRFFCFFLFSSIVLYWKRAFIFVCYVVFFILISGVQFNAWQRSLWQHLALTASPLWLCESYNNNNNNNKWTFALIAYDFPPLWVAYIGCVTQWSMDMWFNVFFYHSFGVGDIELDKNNKNGWSEEFVSCFVAICSFLCVYLTHYPSIASKVDGNDFHHASKFILVATHI